MILCSFCKAVNNAENRVCDTCGRSLQGSTLETENVSVTNTEEVVTVVDQINSGTPRPQILRELKDKGYSDEVASQILSLADGNRQLGLKKGGDSEGVGSMVLGGAILGIGALITIGTYTAASSGGTYFVAWGAMAYGAFKLIGGFIKWTNSK